MEWQLRDPESGALPIWPLLSADSQLYPSFHYLPKAVVSARHFLRHPLANSLDCLTRKRAVRLAADCAGPQAFGVMIDKFVATLQQRGILAMLLDHIAQFAQVVD
jgi:hypothetical protein